MYACNKGKEAMNLRGRRARRIQEGLEGKEKGRGCTTGHESEILKIFNFRKGTKKNALEKPLGYWCRGRVPGSVALQNH